MVVGEQDEQRQVWKHHGGVDTVTVHVPEDVLRVTIGGRPGELPVLGDRPTVESDGVQFLEVSMPAWHQRLIKREFLFPEGPIPQLLGKARLEQIDGLNNVRIA